MLTSYPACGHSGTLQASAVVGVANAGTNIATTNARTTKVFFLDFINLTTFSELFKYYRYYIPIHYLLKIFLW